MDPVTIGVAIGKLAADTAISKGLETLLGGALKSGRERRAEAFVRSFLQAVAGDGQLDQAEVAAKLEELSKSEACRDALYMAYRRLALSASKEIGPRLIALLTARVIRHQRQPTDLEERLLIASEALSDEDFKSFHEFLEITATRRKSGEIRGEVEERDGFIWRRLHTVSDDSNWPSGEVDISAVNFADELGTWALKLRNAGLVMDRLVLRQVSYEEDGERGVDQPGRQTHWSWWVVFRADLLDLSGLIATAIQSTTS